MASQTVERRRETFRKWYENHRAEFNKQRRQRYKKDDEYRVRAISHSQKYRKKEHVVSGVKHHRLVDGQMVRVYRISQAAKLVGRSVQTLRAWEKLGFVPPLASNGQHRVYRMHQIKLMQRIALLYDHHKYNQPLLNKKLWKLKKFIADRWDK